LEALRKIGHWLKGREGRPWGNRQGERSKSDLGGEIGEEPERRSGAIA